MKDATINKEYKFIAYLWNVPWVTQTRLSGGPTRSFENYGQLQRKCRSTLSVTIIVILNCLRFQYLLNFCQNNKLPKKQVNR